MLHLCVIGCECSRPYTGRDDARELRAEITRLTEGYHQAIEWRDKEIASLRTALKAAPEPPMPLTAEWHRIGAWDKCDELYRGWWLGQRQAALGPAGCGCSTEEE